MKIIIKGTARSGKSYFFLPEIIKLLKPKRIFQVKSSNEIQNYKYSPHWSSIKWEYYNKDVLLNSDDLIFIDEPLCIENKEERNLINNHTNVVMNIQPDFIDHQDWIENLKNYLIIDSIYIKPNDFPLRLFNCPLEDKKKELKNLIDRCNKGKVGTSKPPASFF